ncbi:MAG: hypothetical protein ACFE96_02170 [Candidatus Hermodarchaeota archaeon]
MDIAKFNQELSYKVAKANGLEKHKRWQEAIDLWLDISEMALNASKTPKIEVYYKSMLIEKTKQIINHIKDLKAKLYAQRGITQPIHREVFPSQEPSEVASNENAIEDVVEQSPTKTYDSATFSGESAPSGKDVEVKVIEDTDLKNLPIGFKEIEAPEDFKIITPHDEDHVKKMLSQDHDVSVFTYDDKEVKIQDRIEPEQPRDKNKMICFACGSEIPVNSKTCMHCGTSLK